MRSETTDDREPGAADHRRDRDAIARSREVDDRRGGQHGAGADREAGPDVGEVLAVMERDLADIVAIDATAGRSRAMRSIGGGVDRSRRTPPR